MGAIDIATTKYLRNNEIFADVFNYYLYGGKQVIQPGSLVAMDSKEVDLPYGAEDAPLPVERLHDVIKAIVSMTDGRTAYFIFAIESQTKIHYAMPVRDMVYTSLNYAEQVKQTAKSHKAAGDYNGASSDEYLSGFMKNDRLLPVLTLVIHFSPFKWDGPTSLYEMFDLKGKDKELLPLIPDYRINLIEPATIDDEGFNKFNSTLSGVLKIIKYSGPGQEKQMMELLHSSEVYKDFGRDEIDVLNFCVNADLKINKNKEVDNVKFVWDEIREEAAAAKEEAVQAKKEAVQAKEEAVQAKEEATQAKEEATQAKEEATQAKEKAIKEKAKAEAAIAELNAAKAELERVRAELASLRSNEAH